MSVFEKKENKDDRGWHLICYGKMNDFTHGVKFEVKDTLEQIEVNLVEHIPSGEIYRFPNDHLFCGYLYYPSKTDNRFPLGFCSFARERAEREKTAKESECQDFIEKLLSLQFDVEGEPEDSGPATGEFRDGLEVAVNILREQRQEYRELKRPGKVNAMNKAIEEIQRLL